MTFDDMFKTATEIKEGPYDYQRRIAEEAEFPSLIEVPTGAGKTAAVILGWLWRRQFASDEVKRATPRRLVYCLPMRVLVEQTRDFAVTWFNRLGLLGGSFKSDRDEDGDDAHKIKVHLLMGGDVDRDWDMYPERDAILIGTQDMLLSRALNRGYAMSRYRWPVQFGLLNNDCLWVMDEVQLMGPGLWTSAQLDWMRKDRFKSLLPCHTLWMSATNSQGFLDTIDRRQSKIPQPSLFSFHADELPSNLRNAQRPCELWSPPVTKKRKTARTKDEAEPLDDFLKSLARAIADRHIPRTLSLIVCNRVRTAQQVLGRLKDLDTGGADLLLLTSRLRKKDRKERIARLLEFEQSRKVSKPKKVAEHPGIICVSTQVIEAGVDISAHSLWCEIAPWPSMLQRLGRLNRDGCANDEARAYFFELPAVKKKGLKSQAEGPYEPRDVEMGRWLMKELSNICGNNPRVEATRALQMLADVQGAKQKLEQSLEPKPEPFPRAIDVHGLFSTEADLFGGFTDISQYIRSIDPNADLVVFWREFDPTKPLPVGDDLVGPRYDEDEGCSVRTYALRDKLLKNQENAWTWDEREDRWTKIRATDLCPGMVVMLSRINGGYSPDIGWTGDKKDRLSELPSPGPFAQSFNIDPFTENGMWVEIETHLEDSAKIAADIVHRLGLATSHPDVAASIIKADEVHDVGKTHPQWRDELPKPSPDANKFWAKAPFLLAVHASREGFSPEAVEDVLNESGIAYLRLPNSLKQKGRFTWQASMPVSNSSFAQSKGMIEALPGSPRVWMVPFRPGLRHEAASALAMWHEYFRSNARFAALVIYLVAAHHGKVRTVLTARKPDGKDVCGVPIDSRPLPWNGGILLDFNCATDGAAGYFTPDRSGFIQETPGWTALVADLLGGWEPVAERSSYLAIRNDAEPAYLGPFQLSFLEAIVRSADARASANPSHPIPVGGEL